MPSPLFSRYSQGENRVTASILAVFERISFSLVERILQILNGEPSLPFFKIKNQSSLEKQIQFQFQMEWFKHHFPIGSKHGETQQQRQNC